MCDLFRGDVVAKKITTIASVDAAKADPSKQIEYPDSKVPGMALRVSPAGRKTWTLRYRTAEGDQRRLTLGTYPTLSLSQARDSAFDELRKATQGKDPARDRQAAKVAAKSRKLSTVTDLIESYLDDAAKGRHRPNARPNRASTIKQDRDYFERLIKPKLGKRPIGDVTRAELQKFLHDTEDAHGPTAARMCGTLIRASFNYGIRREAIDKNPAALLEIPRAGSRDRVLTDKEMKAIWATASAPPEDVGVSALMGVAVRLAMVTLQRGGEVCGMSEGEIDETAKTWTIPGERTKNHLTHLVPLPPLALDLINRARKLRGKESNYYLFPSPRKRKKGEGTISRHALTRAVKHITTHLNIKNATPHDFRRTGATNITSERIGLPRFIVSRVLNQISDTGGAAAVTGVYDRNEYLAEKRKALEAWANLLKKLIPR